jgi:four helix bundle protein
MVVANGQIDIPKRSLSFGVRVLRLVRALPRDLAGQAVARQLARCGTSVGANVEEAQAAQSKADFARRMNIARAEAKEALYWLRMVAEAGILPKSRLGPLTKEADELIRVLTAIVRTCRENPNHQRG